MSCTNTCLNLEVSQYNNSIILLRKHEPEQQTAICSRLSWGQCFICFWSFCLYLQTQPSEAKDTNKPMIREKIILTSLCCRQNELHFYCWSANVNIYSIFHFCCSVIVACQHTAIKGKHKVFLKVCSKSGFCVEPGPKTAFLTSWIIVSHKYFLLNPDSSWTWLLLNNYFFL